MKKTCIKTLWILIFFVILLGEIPFFQVYAEDVNPEEIEAEKGIYDYQDPITVEIMEADVQAVDADIAHSTYNFEKTIQEIDQNYDIEYGNVLSAAINDYSIRTVKIRKDDLALLKQFSNMVELCYQTKQMPDFSTIFNLDNQPRKENMILMQSFIYQSGIVRTFHNISCESEIKVKNVEIINENVREIVFRLEQNICMDGHEQFEGMWFIADIIDTENGVKIINMWTEGPLFEMMRERVAKILQKRSDEDVVEVLKNEIFNECEQSTAAMLTAEPWQSDEEEPEDKYILNDNLRVRTTLYGSHQDGLSIQ